LVDEGLVILEMPYMQVDAEGTVTENVSDILYYTLVNPSMTRLNAELAPFQQIDAKRKPIAEAMADLGLTDPESQAVFSSAFMGDQEMFLYQPNYGLAPVRSAAVMIGANQMTELFMPYSSFRVSLANDKVESLTGSLKGGQVTADPLKVELVNASGDLFTNFFNSEFVVRLAYRGQASLNELKVMHSIDGEAWSVLPLGTVLMHQPASDYQPGYVVLRTSELGYLAVADDKGPVMASCLEPDSCGL
ncbi:MAG: hypothetical protein MI754_11370, partial [Chromatiales bacterium]|nr:hypothetical protein [Chromatiales bacterium]